MTPVSYVIGRFSRGYALADSVFLSSRSHGVLLRICLQPWIFPMEGVPLPVLGGGWLPLLTNFQHQLSILSSLSGWGLPGIRDYPARWDW